MQPAFDIQIRVLSCESCGAPVRAPDGGGACGCDYCGTQMMLAERRLEPVRVLHQLEGPARIAKLRLQTGRDLPDNPYSTVRTPPGCESLTHSGRPEVLEQIAQRFREALPLVRADPSFEHQRLLWWCATMANQGYGMHGKHLERRAMLERALEELRDPGFRHMIFVNLAGAAARAGEQRAARAWIEKCDPSPEDLMLDSGYRIGLASVLVREGDAIKTLATVGPRVGDVPEAHQHRLMFAMYRIHAHEQLGDLDAAKDAADALRSDPEVGAVLAEALRMNELAPRTRAELTGALGPVVEALRPEPGAQRGEAARAITLVVGVVALAVLAITALLLVAILV